MDEFFASTNRHLPFPGHMAMGSGHLLWPSGEGAPMWKSPLCLPLLILATASGLIPVQRVDNGMRGKGMESKYWKPDYPKALSDLLHRLWSEHE